MPAAARKKPAAPEATAAAPMVPVPDERVPLHDAIQAKRTADARVATHREAIARAKRTLADLPAAEAEVPKKPKVKTGWKEYDHDEWSLDEPDDTDERIEAADLADTRGAVTELLKGQNIVRGWRGDHARRSLAVAREERVQVSRALEQLERELIELRVNASLAQSNVQVEVNRLVEPLAAAALARLQALRSSTAETQGLLQALLRDTPPSFPDGGDTRAFLRQLDATKERAAPFGSIKADAERLRMMPPGATHEEQTITAQLAAEVANQLAALCLNPLAELPTLPKD